jgi:prepilin-type N-terminal cleavage/methylation domain-containing protein/prepilin-type processing-associated H-X9-DG protein
MRHTTHKTRAFTIIELLTVLAIIALLMAILMPALNRSRQVSARVVCASNLRQYSIAGASYLNDNNDLFPDPAECLYANASDTPEHPIACRWHDRIMRPSGDTMRNNPHLHGKMWPYVDELAAHACPTFRRFGASRGCQNPGHNRKIDIDPQYSYTMNAYLGSTRPGAVLRLDAARDPAEVFFFAEENPWTIDARRAASIQRGVSAPLSTKALDDTALLITPTPEAADCFATYHGVDRADLDTGWSNIAFLDGHVEAIEAEDQLRKNMHGGDSILGPAGNLRWAWADETPPPGGWNAQ